jgi:hypothetical protein
VQAPTLRGHADENRNKTNTIISAFDKQRQKQKQNFCLLQAE